MGIAAYNRGSKLIRQELEQGQRHVVFEIIENLNALPKDPKAIIPWGEVRYAFSHGGCWGYCPETGFGYWYKTLHQAVQAWHITIVRYENGEYVGKPTKGELL